MVSVQGLDRGSARARLRITAADAVIPRPIAHLLRDLAEVDSAGRRRAVLWGQTGNRATRAGASICSVEGITTHRGTAGDAASAVVEATVPLAVVDAALVAADIASVEVVATALAVEAIRAADTPAAVAIIAEVG